MGVLDQFIKRGIRLELADNDNVRAIGNLNDSLRAAIKTQKIQIIGELQQKEFDVLLAIVAPAHNTPAQEYADIRGAAEDDLTNALIAFREMGKFLISPTT